MCVWLCAGCLCVFAGAFHMTNNHTYYRSMYGVVVGHITPPRVGKQSKIAQIAIARTSRPRQVALNLCLSSGVDLPSAKLFIHLLRLWRPHRFIYIYDCACAFILKRNSIKCTQNSRARSVYIVRPRRSIIESRWSIESI